MQTRTTRWLFGSWAVTAVLIGGVLMSYHQPFLSPDERVLKLARDPGHGQWRALHLLSGSCGCSQRVMLHLLGRHPLEGLLEQVLLVDGPGDDLPGSKALAVKLQEEGFEVTHLAVKDIPEGIGLRGVPLLVIASPENKIAYLGGYGSAEEKDQEIYRQVLSGAQPKGLPIIGCAIGARLHRSADPFHLKY